MAAAIALITTLTACSSAPSSGRAIADPSKIRYADSYDFEKLSFDGIEKKEVSILIEAETAEENSGVAVKTDAKGYSGDGYVDISDNTQFRLTADIPSSQYYKLTVTHRAGSHKENPLIFNGLKAMDIYSENDDWQQTTVDGIFLEKGENIITLGEGWSWFSLDAILIENGEALSDAVYENAAETLCNPYANLKTQNIYQYLKAVYGKRTLSGQCTNYGTDTETDAIFLGYGKYPAVRTFDFIYDSLSFCHGEPQAKDVDLAVQWSKDGGLVAFDWHWYAPMNQCEFYSEKTTFSLSNAVTDEEIALLAPEEIQ